MRMKQDTAGDAGRPRRAARVPGGQAAATRGDMGHRLRRAPERIHALATGRRPTTRGASAQRSGGRSPGVMVRAGHDLAEAVQRVAGVSREPTEVGFRIVACRTPHCEATRPVGGQLTADMEHMRRSFPPPA